MSTEINIEDIMDEIRMDIRERGLSSDMLSFRDVSCEAEDISYENDEYMEILHQINASGNIPWNRELAGGKVKRLIKKMIRKVISLILLPMSEEQNLFNSLTAREFNQLAGYVNLQEKTMESYRKEIDLLKEKIEKLETKLDEKA